MHRRGTVFIFILAVLGVIFAVAFGLLSSSRLAAVSAFETDPQVLARQVAREGLDHAIALIELEFRDKSAGVYDSDPNTTGVPTQLTDRWRTYFWPIDTHLFGADTPWPSDNRPRGHEFSPHDINENDVHLENQLGEHYCKVGRSQKTYLARESMYNEGKQTATGSARWFEPGLRNDESKRQNPAENPLSFHLAFPLGHPVTANPSSEDPAWKHGENWSAVDEPDAQPVRYDANLRATDDPSQVRYRLRYAVSVEPLDGHLINTLPGDYDPNTPKPTTDVMNPLQPASTATTDTFVKSVEVDKVRADRWAAAMTTMAELYCLDPYSIDLSFTGRGWKRDARFINGTNSDLLSHGSLAAMSSGKPIGHMDFDTDDSSGAAMPNWMVDSTFVADRDCTLAHELLGPVPSFQAYNRDIRHTSRMYLYTPFGKAPRKVDAATPAEMADLKWDEGVVDTPWRLNFPTAAPKAISNMLYGYLPQEFRVGDYDRRTTEDFDKMEGSAQWKNYTSIPLSGSDRRIMLPTRNLFDLMSDQGYFNKYGGIAGVTSYPGTDVDTPSIWRTDLGKHNWMNSVEKFNVPRVPVLGSQHPYTFTTFTTITPREEQWPGGQRVQLVPSGRGETFQSGPGAYGDGGYYYAESYWMDIANGFLHAMAVAQAAWSDRVPSGWLSENRLDRQKFWGNEGPPSAIPDNDKTVPADYFDPPTPPVGNWNHSWTYTRDYDVDCNGDGTVDANGDNYWRVPDPWDTRLPSAYDSVKDLDRQFVINMSEHWGDFKTGERPLARNERRRPLFLYTNSKIAAPGICMWNKFTDTTSGATWDSVPAEFMQPIAQQLRQDGEGNDVPFDLTQPTTPVDPANPPALLPAEGELMELVLNDFRMSFFGASPQYPDFQPIDFSDDGFVRCSAYPNGFVDADPATGKGRVIDPSKGDRRFSLTGYFVFTKCRYYRVFVRGEVFDTIQNLPVSQSNLEAVYVCDPDGDVWTLNMEKPATQTTGMSDSHVIFQRYHTNAYRGFQAHVDR